MAVDLEAMRKTHKEIVESDGGECEMMRNWREMVEEIEQLSEENRLLRESLLSSLRHVENALLSVEGPAAVLLQAHLPKVRNALQENLVQPKSQD